MLCLIPFSSRAAELPAPVEKIVHAIWLAEGGEKTRFPYGIKGMKTRSVNHARKICHNTVNRAAKDWQAWGWRNERCFIQFLANRYCPKQTDPAGHANWVLNVRWFIRRA